MDRFARDDGPSSAHTDTPAGIPAAEFVFTSLDHRGETRSTAEPVDEQEESIRSPGAPRSGLLQRVRTDFTPRCCRLGSTARVGVLRSSRTDPDTPRTGFPVPPPRSGQRRSRRDRPRAGWHGLSAPVSALSENGVSPILPPEPRGPIPRRRHRLACPERHGRSPWRSPVGGKRASARKHILGLLSIPVAGVAWVAWVADERCRQADGHSIAVWAIPAFRNRPLHRKKLVFSTRSRCCERPDFRTGRSDVSAAVGGARGTPPEILARAAPAALTRQ